jgi:ABC-type polysaccharide/polyol phosphate transport system ATPase subunit
MGAGLVRVEGVWKQFHRGEHHDALRDLVPALVRRVLGAPARPREAFWALRDVSFEVRPGQALGIIGPNGAGKSTLLRLLSRLLRPTRGRLVVEGRVGALIEITAGFHPDLTGRENLFLQGAVMGMKRADIHRKFPEIVEFAGFADFIDTPVKRYSSGMSARLGFSIAAHLDPDVLLIDEVLAVGDLAFQQRAFERLETIVRRDIPVVVVSHQLDRIASLCAHALLLDQGHVVRQGSPAECIEAYVSSHSPSPAAAPAGAVRVASLAVEPREGVLSGGWIHLAVEGAIGPDGDPEAEELALRVRSTESGQPVFMTTHPACGAALPETGPFTLFADLQMNVPPGVYLVEVLVRDRRHVQVLARGPRARIHVRPARSFVGTVQMNPRMRVTPLERMKIETSP